MWFVIIFSILFFLLLALLLLPVEIMIHTGKGIYQVRNRLLFAAQYIPDDDWGKLRLRILFVWITIDPGKWMFKSHSQTKKAKKKDTHRKQTQKKSFGSVLLLIRRLTATIKTKYLTAQIDTGNFPLNAQLIPLAQTFSSGEKQITVNFQNNNQLAVCIQHRPVNALIVLFKHYLLIRKK